MNRWLFSPKLVLPAFVLLMNVAAAHAQNHAQLDSLLRELDGAVGQERIDLLNHIAYYQDNPPRALDYQMEALELADQLGIEDVRTLSNISATFINLGSYDQALRHLLRARKHLDEHDAENVVALINVLTNIGTVYWAQGEFASALAHYRRALAASLRSSDSLHVANSNVYVAGALKELERYGEALVHARRGLAQQRTVENESGVMHALITLGDIHLKQGAHDDVVATQEEALALARESGNVSYQAWASGTLAKAHKALGHLSEAEEHALASLEWAEAASMLDAVMENTKLLSEVYARQGIPDEAYTMLLRHTASKDSIFSRRRTQELNELRTQYETEQKEQQIVLLQQQKEVQTFRMRQQQAMLLGGGVGLLLVLLAAGALYRGNRLKRRANRLLEEKNHQLERLSLVAEKSDNAVLIAGPDGVVEWVNEGFRRRSGFDLDQWRRLYGANVLVGPALGDGYGGAHTALVQQATRRGEPAYFEQLHENAAGTPYWVASTLTPVLDEAGQVRKLVVIETDITERKQAEDHLAALLQEKDGLLAEKEMLMKEIHHRVKNNLQIVSSLLNLQAHATGEPFVQQTLYQVRSRIIAMALIHQKLYQSEGLARIALDAYVEDLVGFLFQTFCDDAARVRYVLEVDEVELGMDTAVPLGLILAELVSNAFKYAFPEERAGTVRVALRRLPPDRFELCVADDGVGLPAEAARASSGSLGLSLVRDLARQLQGDVDVQSDGGTCVILRFREGARHVRPAPRQAAQPVA